MTPRPRVLCTHKIPETGLNVLKKTMEVKILDENLPIDSQLQESLPTSDFLVPLLSVDITEELMDLAPSLRGISNYAVGYNNIDIAAAKKRGILVTNTPDVLTDSTADLVWGLILAVTRRIVEGDKVCRGDTFTGWLPEYLLGFEITGKTLGIIGLGRIGTAVAKRACGFDMKILYHSRTRKRDIETQYELIFKETLEEVLKEADIISINVPYTPETHHLISKQELSLMKSSAYLINTSRGRVINERDLIIALRKKVITGAGLDVFYDEPSIPQELRNLQNVVLTPHIGSATTQARNAMARMVAENILAIELGEQPPNIVPEMRQKEKMGKE
ncbi:MAG: 2-hydroxyacid dehydrogenase [Candidatus Hodarchaeales archaeon]|jgi:glyoxylate reductase